MTWPRGERGAGSVLVLMVVLVVVTALVAVGALASGYTARRQAAAAADLAALAAADHLAVGGTDPCGVASEVASGNGADLRDCVVDGAEVEVGVRVRPRSMSSWLPAQDRRARAGPGAGATES